MEEPNFPKETIELCLKIKSGTATEEEFLLFEAKKNDSMCIA